MDLINYKFICTLQIWDRILESVDRVNVPLQSKTIDKASELIKGSTSQISNIRKTVDIALKKARRICKQCDIEDKFPEMRRKLVKRHDSNINATEFWAEIETLKSKVEATTLFDECYCQSSMGLLKAILELDLKIVSQCNSHYKDVFNDASDCSFLREIIQ
ncbi:hypothetical protein HHI36_023530 [Cryptolaemus montrouzieri]|uniref:Uncharacterized protein n=1 Tax=Cryptolaemus montrouzieri TaxID=559131 RepID=A0ABD2PHB2_9CUCU